MKIVKIVGNTVVPEEEMNFDPWGRRRNPDDWTFNDVPTPVLLSRGLCPRRAGRIPLWTRPRDTTGKGRRNEQDWLDRVGGDGRGHGDVRVRSIGPDQGQLQQHGAG